HDSHTFDPEHARERHVRGMPLTGPQLRPVQTRAFHLHQAPALPNRWYRQLTDLQYLRATRPDTDRRSHRRTHCISEHCVSERAVSERAVFERAVFERAVSEHRVA